MKAVQFGDPATRDDIAMGAADQRGGAGHGGGQSGKRGGAGARVALGGRCRWRAKAI